MAEKTERLVCFRDQWLEKSEPGKWLIRTYYEYCPPIADYIAERGWVKVLVRTLLLPLVGLVSFVV